MLAYKRLLDNCRSLITCAKERNRYMGEGCHMEASIEALVVDDSAFMRAVITDILERNGIAVVAEASDGHEAVHAVEQHGPDVVTMDLSMPRMDGLKAVEVIMHRQPTPILILSSHAGEDAEITFDALQRGAVDFFTKPSGELSNDLASVEDRLVETVRSVATSNPPVPADSTADTSHSFGEIEVSETSPILAIASSTGGPSVVERILAELPAAANFRVIVVQHMPATFTNRFADRLNRKSDYRIVEAEDGLEIAPGEGVVAAGGYHLVVDEIEEDRLSVSLDDSSPRHNVKPAADVTFESLAADAPAHVVGVVLTGMGEDGAAGLARLNKHGAHVIAQDEASCVVFGMPKRAIEAGCVDTIAPEPELADAILRGAEATTHRESPTESISADRARAQECDTT